MRIVISSILLLSIVFFSCTEKKNSLKTNDVFVISYPKDFEGKRIIVKDTNATIRFSREFLDYFLQSHPRVSMTIFGSYRYEDHYPYYEIADTSYSYYEVGTRVGDLGLIISDSVGGI